MMVIRWHACGRIDQQVDWGTQRGVRSGSSTFALRSVLRLLPFTSTGRPFDSTRLRMRITSLSSRLCFNFVPSRASSFLLVAVSPRKTSDLVSHKIAMEHRQPASQTMARFRSDCYIWKETKVEKKKNHNSKKREMVDQLVVRVCTLATQSGPSPNDLSIGFSVVHVCVR